MSATIEELKALLKHKCGWPTNIFSVNFSPTSKFKSRNSIIRSVTFV